MKRHFDDHPYKDPVCGMQVSHLTAIEVLQHKGRTYYFCAGTCREAFEAEPGKYIHHHRQHGMKLR